MIALVERGSRSRFVIAAAALSGAACQETVTDATPRLAIECTATPASGLAPLTVAFGLSVSNAVGTVDVVVDYGDGARSTDPGARHVYAQAGSYAASITVTAGAESARCSLAVAVAAGPTPTPTPAAENRWPDPSFRTTPTAIGASITGKAPLGVLYNLCRSQDPDGDGLFFRMDLDGDGRFEHFGTTGADCSRQATHALGTHAVTLCVTDGYCPSWPLCEDLPAWRFHPYQCESYTVIATP